MFENILKLKSVEHFLETRARVILGMEMSTKPNWNNFFSRVKVYFVPKGEAGIKFEEKF